MYIMLSDSPPFLFLKIMMNIAFITVFIWWLLSAEMSWS
jgi:hypothetical protein